MTKHSQRNFDIAIANALLLGGVFRVLNRPVAGLNHVGGPIETLHVCYIPTPGATWFPTYNIMAYETHGEAAVAFLSTQGFFMTVDGEVYRI